jgi:hypothetical protein
MNRPPEKHWYLGLIFVVVQNMRTRWLCAVLFSQTFNMGELRETVQPCSPGLLNVNLRLNTATPLYEQQFEI